jgi:hypothetical protein
LNNVKSKQRENKRKLAREEKRKKITDLEEERQMTIDTFTKRM